MHCGGAEHGKDSGKGQQQLPIDANQATMQFPLGKLVIAVAASVYTERMGHIRLSCEGGCACLPIEYNLLHPFYR